MGITRVANITGLDVIGIPVAAAYRPNSRNIAVSQGKGLDLVSAKVSALMESIESFHAERVMLPLRLASLSEITSGHERVVDVTALASVIESGFHPDRPILWIAARNLFDNEPTWIPFECVHTNYTLPLPAGSQCFQATSNGLSGGNHLLEAISHAVCELVERDAVALWYAGQNKAGAAAQIDLSTIDDPDCLGVIELYIRAGVSVAAWDITSDIGIPTFLCVIHSPDEPRDGFLKADGMGCHPSRSIALLRALTEAAQSRLTVIAGARDDLMRDSYRDRPPIQPEVQPQRDFRQIPQFLSDTFDHDVAWEARCLQAAGLDQILVVDLSDPGFGIPVVRVVIPGLEGVCFQPDYVRGRRAEAAAGSTI
jgi:ribosomal protein S12 methylthiotransferase accessory factor